VDSIPSRSEPDKWDIHAIHDNQGLLIASSNNVGLVRALAFDVDDRVTNSTDANDVGVGMTYDNLSRLLTRNIIFISR
jgi:YD repeat-containing protein